MRALLSALTIAFLAGPAIAHDGVHDGVHVEAAYARVAMENAPAGAVFMEIVNHGTQDDRLIAAESDVAARAEMHTHVMSAEGMMQMLPVAEGFAVAAAQTYALARGGDHIMLMGLTRPMPEGSQFTLTLTFERAGKIVVVVPVRSDDPAGHDSMDHSGHDAPANP
jgi:periplasmic copper chaperone A